MDMRPELKLSQSQKLVMTPELKQAIKLLQYTSYELKEFVAAELLNNPILQSHDDNICEQDNVDWRAVSEDCRRSGTGNYENSESKEFLDTTNMLSVEISLCEHLISQLHWLNLSQDELDLGTYLIENIDDNGYIQLTDDEIDNSLTHKMLLVIQGFEPAGVGSRNIEECLMIQLNRLEISDEVELSKTIVKYHMEDLANNKLDKIANVLQVKQCQVKSACEIIRSLEPKPGREFSSLRRVRYITPDVYVEKVGEDYNVLVNESVTPRLYISKYYTDLLSLESTSSSVSKYIREKLKAGLQIIKGIEERRITIRKVAEQIVKLQHGFFESGDIYLKPMTLKDVAVEMDVHESTVSRAVNGKYLQCAQGVFLMKHFFQSGVQDVCGQGISAQSVKILLKDLIDGEDRKKPLSDQKISNIFIRSGVKVSRRTIAKYRESMGIPSTSKRKVY